MKLIISHPETYISLHFIILQFISIYSFLTSSIPENAAVCRVCFFRAYFQHIHISGSKIRRDREIYGWWCNIGSSLISLNISVQYELSETFFTRSKLNWKTYRKRGVGAVVELKRVLWNRSKHRKTDRGRNLFAFLFSYETRNWSWVELSIFVSRGRLHSYELSMYRTEGVIQLNASTQVQKGWHRCHLRFEFQEN